MNRLARVSIHFSAVGCFALFFMSFLSVGVASAAVPVIQGRWEFAITSGDTADQLNLMGQSTFTTYLLQSGNTLTNVVHFTTDTVACDLESRNNVTVSNSSVDDLGNVTVIFTVTQADQTTFQFVFTGVLAVGPPEVITGTYQRTAGGCTQGSLGTGTPDGTFTATYFPDMNGTWAGAFDANQGPGPIGVPATFTLTTNADKTLSGTISSPGLTNGSGTSCLASPVTLQAGMIEGVSYAAGVGLELFGTDTNGTRLWVIADAINPDGSIAAVGEDNPSAPGNTGTVNDGTNNSYEAFYGISGGPCDGLGGGDAPFQLLAPKKKDSKRDRDHRSDHGRSGHDRARGRF